MLQGGSTENRMQRPRSASQTSELRGIRPAGLGLREHQRRLSKEASTISPAAPSREWKPRPPQSNPVRLAGELYDPTRPSPVPYLHEAPGPMHGPLMPTNFQQLAAPPPPPPSRSPLLLGSHTNTSRSGKNKLNLLNPMSLLARRRSSRRVAEESERYSKLNDPSTPALRLPDDYDPRIRGKGVHDFSVPRSAQSNQSPPKSSNGQEPNSSSSREGSASAPIYYEQSPNSLEREHTPVFKENFDDDAEPWQDGREGSTKRQKSAFMYKVAVQEPYSEPDPSSLPAFARNLPADFPGDTDPLQRVASPLRAPLEAVLETAMSDSISKDLSPIPSPPTSPPSKARSRASSDTDSSFTPAGLPAHFKSNASRASRFSFDLAGVGSAAQEKLLEEKHRQKAKEKARASTESSKIVPPDESDDEQDPDLEDYDDDDDDDGFEERIPGVNADAEGGAPPSQPGMPAMGAFRFEPSSKTTFVNQMSPVSEGFSPISLQDAHYQPARLIVPESSPNTAKDEDSPVTHESSEEEHRSQRESRTTIDNEFVIPISHQLPAKPFEATTAAYPPNADYLEDDMYFDDGMIEDPGGTNEHAFDESVFDDETSRIYGLPIRDQPKSQLSTMDGESSTQPMGVQARLQLKTSLMEEGHKVGEDNIADEMRDLLPDLTQTARPIFSHTAGLTQDNLAAYHDALALAANQAAMNGKFVRRASLQSEQSNDPLSPENNHLDPFPPVGQSPSLEINGYPLPQNALGSDNYDFDDAASDDAIIAAANAEALENDDEDFYGQEFGFYARKTGGSDEYTHGGYFGPGINRTHSGRNVEPALTPITERSEWSNRNSAISLAMQGYPTSALSQPSPGLAQLADMMTLEESNENDMSLSALMKLRRGAWGSSTTSLHSSSGNSSGSPLTYNLPNMPANGATGMQIPPPPPPQQHHGQAYPMLNTNVGASTYSLNSSTTEDSPASDASHTITLPSVSFPPNPAVNAPYMPPPAAPSHSRSGSEGSPTQIRPRSLLFNNAKGKATAGKTHSRNASKDGESVSYVHERDEEGDRWVLEKRKIGEGGVVEVLGREVVEGGRI